MKSEECCHGGVLCCSFGLFLNRLLRMFLTCAFFCLHLTKPLVRETCAGAVLEVLLCIMHSLYNLKRMLCIQIGKVCCEIICLCQ